MKVVKRLKIAISGDCSPLGRLCEMWLHGHAVGRIESPTFQKTSTFQKARTFQKHPLHKLKRGHPLHKLRDRDRRRHAHILGGRS